MIIPNLRIIIFITFAQVQSSMRVLKKSDITSLQGGTTKQSHNNQKDCFAIARNDELKINF